MTKREQQQQCYEDTDDGDEQREEDFDEYSVEVVNYVSEEQREEEDNEFECNEWSKQIVRGDPICGNVRSRQCDDNDDHHDPGMQYGSKVRGIMEAYNKALDLCRKECNRSKHRNAGVWYSSCDDDFNYRVATIFLTELMRNEVLSNTKRKAKRMAALNSLNDEARRLVPHLLDAWNDGALNSSQTAPEPAVFLIHNRGGGKSSQCSSKPKIIEIKQLVNNEGKCIIPFNDLYSRVHNVIPNVVKILHNLKTMKIVKFHYCGNGCCRFAYKIRRRDRSTNKVVAYMTSGKFDVHDIVANLNESYIIINDWDAFKEAIASNNDDNRRCCGSPLLLQRDDAAAAASSTTVVDFKDRKGVSWIHPANKVAEIKAIIELSPSLRDMPEMLPLVAELDRIVTKVL